MPGEVALESSDAQRASRWPRHGDLLIEFPLVTPQQIRSRSRRLQGAAAIKIVDDDPLDGGVMLEMRRRSIRSILR